MKFAIIFALMLNFTLTSLAQADTLWACYDNSFLDFVVDCTFLGDKNVRILEDLGHGQYLSRYGQVVGWNPFVVKDDNGNAFLTIVGSAAIGHTGTYFDLHMQKFAVTCVPYL